MSCFCCPVCFTGSPPTPPEHVVAPSTANAVTAPATVPVSSLPATIPGLSAEGPENVDAGVASGSVERSDSGMSEGVSSGDSAGELDLRMMQTDPISLRR